MEINNRPEAGPSGRFTSQHVWSAILALAGLATFGYAHTLPWIAVRPGQDLHERLRGLAPSGEVRTYALTDLTGSEVALYLGWLALLSVLVLAWVRPQWRDALRIAAKLSTLAVVALTFLPSGAAVDASGFPRADRPDSTYLAGTWLALSALGLLSRAALSALPRPHPTGTATTTAPPDESRAPEAEPPAGPEPAASGPATAGATGGHDGEPVPPFVTSSDWARPRSTSRRRPWLVGAAALGVVAVVLVATVLAWPRPDRSGDGSASERAERGTVDAAGTGDDSSGLGALLVTAPDYATPDLAPVRNDKFDSSRIMTLDEPAAMPVLAQLAGVRHTAGRAWTAPKSASMMVVLLEFGTPQLAEDFQTTYANMERLRRRSNSNWEVQLPSVPGAAAYIGPTGDTAVLPEVRVVARHDDIVVLVTASGGGLDQAATAATLLRRQYERL
ncbi:hypothetical protein [Micromonospora avicenniae]|uniref:Uncharacterized protein n=1 Tax=Micromonospora avicenniae TaxID=1198245 RepID=A0A1N6WST1_9ACTN|nr:hypothetical protein [Micromonospora avicenniae]SIQ93095.1 hypothetical protein SAMN05444858_10593 [Micromonospora avicenniae]